MILKKDKGDRIETKQKWLCSKGKNYKCGSMLEPGICFYPNECKNKVDPKGVQQ